MTLSLHPDFRLRNDDKPPRRRGSHEATVRRVFAHRRRVEAEEPLFAEEDRHKRAVDRTARVVCTRCGRRYGFSLNKSLCSACERAR